MGIVFRFFLLSDCAPTDLDGLAHTKHMPAYLLKSDDLLAV